MPKSFIAHVGKAVIGLAAWGAFTTASVAHDCVAEMHYTAEGKIQLELGNNFAKKTAQTLVPLENVQIRLRRDKHPGSELTSTTVSTDKDGNYIAHGCFARDTNGVLTGGKDIEITIQARFRSDELKLRDANLLDNEWHTVGRYKDRDGGTNDVGVRTYNRAGNITAPEYDELAQIWWLYSREMDRFAKRGAGITKRVTVTYPHNAPRDAATAYAVGRDIFLGSDDGPHDKDEPVVMIHELFHAWHATRLSGDFTSGCILDAHHQPASSWASSRCSGFSEGLAQAGARYLMDRHYRTAVSAPASIATMRRPGNNFPWSPLRTLDDVERTDTGWENIFRYLFAQNEWAPNGLTPSYAACSAKDVKLFELLRALQDENFSLPGATLREVLRILERQVDGFDRRDSDIYEMVLDPANRDVDAMQARVDNEFCKLNQEVRDTVDTGLNAGDLQQLGGDAIKR